MLSVDGTADDENEEDDGMDINEVENDDVNNNEVEDDDVDNHEVDDNDDDDNDENSDHDETLDHKYIRSFAMQLLCRVERHRNVTSPIPSDISIDSNTYEPNFYSIQKDWKTMFSHEMNTITIAFKELKL
jgi:ABC-type Zn2+ transport system substrate-binding protein/surface adhesin